MAKKAKKAKKRAASSTPVTAARAYEAAATTPSRRPPVGASGSQDQQADGALGPVRDWGRFLDENHDVASGVLDELVKNIVGSGIITVPKPLDVNGEVDQVLADEIGEVWSEWTERADVTGELSWHDAQRLICRSWFRDGEEFVQHVQGRTRGFPFAASEVPYRIELLESEMCPWDLTNDRWRQGIQHDGWRRPVAYAMYRANPDGLRFDMRAPVSPDDFRIVPMEQMTHLKVVKRWPATRGVSLFSTVISRLYDIKDLEESERIKDRVLASWVAAVIKSPDIPGLDDADAAGRRFAQMFGGSVIDSLAPGETIQGVGPDYPVANMPEHIADQMRRVASGTGTRYSSISKHYDGNYAAQRQEMVESAGLYGMREDQFVAKICRATYRRFVSSAVLDGKISRPAEFDLRRMSNAEYRGPVTPWIDPLKEVQADALAVEKGFVTLEQVQIKRGASPEIIGRPAPAPAAPVQLALVPPDEEVAA